ncbi:hypothetical protein H6P81_004873 [Aristolochia fimbriata]|uniref:N-acetyltransferase domain-containing protein n=1 Tax=Aristolochia fimbriata TaxID=158543 RepID=A0AAV7ETV8_ARIFI|nr:hypothetical protein H6P81_004873 [Aristolochia fimbriata]
MAAEARGGEETPEITLRKFDLSDIDDFMVWATDDLVSRFCSWDTYTSREAGLAYLRNTVLPHPWLRAICIDDRPVGAISLIPGAGSDACRAELGYVLASGCWGKGIGTRAVKMVVSRVFDEWSHLERVEALVDVGNYGSQRVLEKAGFTREGVLRKYSMLKGRMRDMVMYSFLSTDSVPEL